MTFSLDSTSLVIGTYGLMKISLKRPKFERSWCLQVNPYAKLTDWVFGLFAMAILGNIVLIATVGVSLLTKYSVHFC